MTGWLQHLTPKEYVHSVYHIDLDKLWADGKRLLLSDLDNTLVGWNHPHVPEELAAWLLAAKERGFEICLISNNRGDRVQQFAEQSGLTAIAAARKPRPDAFVRAMNQFGRRPEETVMIGDQLFTDIRGGNAVGIHTVLVLPIDRREWWGTRVVRRLEWFAMRSLVKRGLVIPDQSERR